MNSFLSNLDRGKNSSVKRQLLCLCSGDKDYSIAEISQKLDISVPTATKIIGELINDGYITDMGKHVHSSGRRPVIYGLNPNAGFFIGIEVKRHGIDVAVSNFKGKILDYVESLPVEVKNTEESFREMCSVILSHLRRKGIDHAKIQSYNFSFTGRVNKETGYSFSYFLGEDKPAAALLAAILKCTVYIDNDSRAMTYGEYVAGVANREQNMLFLNCSWGVGMGMVLDGQLYYGRSGYSGEVGHFPILDNDIICHCGKTGCLETGASGVALHRIAVEKLKSGRASSLSQKFRKEGDVTLDDIIKATCEEDILAIEAVEEVGQTMGRAIAGLINIFNPELVVIGGKLAEVKDYMYLPLISSVNKFSLNMVSKETTIKFSEMGAKIGAIGSCIMARNKLLGVL
ncbi:MAG: ROK family transcriptional regulator [Bacteroidales bacterium]|nr:ROK family transcriptional regulator [Bacteroidales bacterium]